MAVRIGDMPPTSRPTRPKARSTSTSGSATSGRSCSPIRRISPRSAPPSSATWRASSRNSTSATPRSSACPSTRSTTTSAGRRTSRRRRARRPTIRSSATRTCKVAKLYDMLPAEAGDQARGRSAADNATVRAVFVIGPDKKIKLIFFYPMTTGRNFDEILRALDSMQLTSKYKVATPAQWQQGDDVIIAGSVSDARRTSSTPTAGGRRSPTCDTFSSRSSRSVTTSLPIRPQRGGTLTRHEKDLPRPGAAGRRRAGERRRPAAAAMAMDGMATTWARASTSASACTSASRLTRPGTSARRLSIRRPSITIRSRSTRRLRRPVYVERGEERQAEPRQDWWYYCEDSRGYYPYVKSCLSGWKRVPPAPPPG